MNYGQELAVTFNGENELICFSEDVCLNEPEKPIIV
jgi:hypothetical protein